MQSERDAMKLRADRPKAEQLKLEEQRAAAERAAKAETDHIEAQRHKFRAEAVRMETENNAMKTRVDQLHAEMLRMKEQSKADAERLKAERQALQESAARMESERNLRKMHAEREKLEKSRKRAELLRNQRTEMERADMTRGGIGSGHNPMCTSCPKGSCHAQTRMVNSKMFEKRFLVQHQLQMKRATASDCFF